MSSASDILQTFTFTASVDGQTIFNGNDDNSSFLIYIAEAVEIYLNGVLLVENIDYVANDLRKITLTQGAQAGDTLSVIAFQRRTAPSASEIIALSISEQDQFTVSINNFAIPDAVDASTQPENIPVSVSGMSSTNLADALAELASSNFRSDTAPTGPNVNEGDQWYDTDDNQLKVYRETSPGVFQWVALIVGSDDSDTVDAGSF
tara:strand:- start:76 stop:690 length:615 start_codon:yes stop_codon:yes gene_type:complete